MSIPFFKPFIPKEQTFHYWDQALQNGWLTYGPLSIELEKKLANFLQAENLVCVNSCTSALLLALKLADLPPKSEVLLPTNTFIATYEVILHAGHIPVLCDIHPDDWNISVKEIQKKCNQKTKAIIAVSFAGMPVNLKWLSAFCKDRRITLILDNAHALESTFDGKPLHLYADFAAYSFYATKNLTTAEGGALVFQNPAYEKKARELILHGMSKDAYRRYHDAKWQYDIVDLGYKMNFNDIHAALGLAQLPFLKNNHQKRKDISEHYQNRLSPHGFQFQQASFPENFDHAYHIMPVMLPKNYSRDHAMQKLNQANIGFSVHFIPLYEMSYVKNQTQSAHFPSNDMYYQRCITLPLYPSLDLADVDFICDVLLN
ncbi:MAG: DegT/DnrJ/EryC1/StrS aminotransferase family protein [Candidatus Hydrogenedentota bacterium]|nr:MAG: DegT/DnrJ/EryC1/StrS aminotransferase family protein [Candidatus Hydrogenedentota bacterium]